MKYDKIIYGFALVVVMTNSAFAQSSSTGMWQDASYTDDLSGKYVTVIKLLPTSNSDNDIDDSTMYIRCKDNNLDLQVDWDQKMTTDSSVQTFELDYRIGQSVQSGNWELSTDNEGLFYPGNVVGFINQLVTSDIFIAQVTPDDGNNITSDFDTTGLINAVQPVLQACGYNQQ